MSVGDVIWTLVPRYGPEMKSQLNKVTALDAASPFCWHAQHRRRGTGEFFVSRMRTVPCIIVLVLVLGTGFRSKAAEPLSASQVTWKQHFGSSTADTNALFCLMAHGYFRAESTNVQGVVDAWLKEHPKAIVISVSTSGPVMTRLPSSRFAYVWVVQGGDSLNVELVRRGCFAAETQILNPDEKLEVSQKDYEGFVQRVTKASESAKEEKAGIWRGGRK